MNSIVLSTLPQYLVFTIRPLTLDQLSKWKFETMQSKPDSRGEIFYSPYAYILWTNKRGFCLKKAQSMLFFVYLVNSDQFKKIYFNQLIRLTFC